MFFFFYLKKMLCDYMSMSSNKNLTLLLEHFLNIQHQSITTENMHIKMVNIQQLYNTNYFNRYIVWVHY